MTSVSVIIPCYNAERFIARCLQSCFAQDYPDLEIIVVDNNSTDASMAIAEAEARKAGRDIVVFPCREQGHKYARTAGVKRSRGRYIQMLDADDELGPGKIAAQAAALDRSSDHGAAYSDWQWCFHQPGGKMFAVMFATRQFDDFLLQVLADNWHPPHAYLYRREVVERVLPVYASDCETAASEDREFIALAALSGAGFLYVPGPMAIYNNWSEQQVSKKVNREQRGASLAQIFGRLRVFADEPGNVRLQTMHRRLLEQPWQLYGLVSGTISPDGSAFSIQGRENTASVAITAPEARLIRILQEYSGSFWLELHARQILRNLHRKAAQGLSPGLTAPAAAREVIDRVDRLFTAPDGLVEKPLKPDLPAQDQEMTVPLPLSLDFLLKGPLYLPKFPMQRYCLQTVLRGLCRKEILAPQ